MPQLYLVASNGATLPVQSDERLAVYVDPAIPPGQYSLLAVAGNQRGSVRVMVTRPTRPAVTKVAPNAFDLTGVSAGAKYTISRHDTECFDIAVHWTQFSLNSVDAQGNVRVVLAATGGLRGQFCFGKTRELCSVF